MFNCSIDPTVVEYTRLLLVKGFEPSFDARLLFYVRIISLYED